MKLLSRYVKGSDAVGWSMASRICTEQLEDRAAVLSARKVNSVYCRHDVQVGCAMNCQFCYTGRMGLLGNLTTAQIVEQVRLFVFKLLTPRA